VHAGDPFDQGAVERPTPRIGDPADHVGHRLDEEVLHQPAGQPGIVDRDVQVTGVDVEAADGEGAAAVQPPPQVTAAGPVGELGEG
jgi:hypothetical protein